MSHSQQPLEHDKQLVEQNKEEIFQSHYQDWMYSSSSESHLWFMLVKINCIPLIFKIKKQQKSLAKPREWFYLQVKAEAKAGWSPGSFQCCQANWSGEGWPWVLHAELNISHGAVRGDQAWALLLSSKSQSHSKVISDYRTAGCSILGLCPRPGTGDWGQETVPAMAGLALHEF